MDTKTTTDNPASRRRWLILLGIVAVGAVCAFAYWLSSRGRESTDDAFIDADIAAVNSKVKGQVLRIDAADNQIVRQGELLLEIDPTDYQVNLGKAKAELEAAQAQARRAQLDAARYKQLFERDQVSRQVYDRATADADVARAEAELARQKLEAAQLDLSYTKIAAPVAGRVTKRAVEVKTFVEVGQPLMAIVPLQVYVTANFKETQLARMRPGQKVRIRVDAYGRRVFNGHVDSVQAGTGARFSLLPPENATGNFVKVVQRVPVKIVFDDLPEGILLAPGMSVVPTVDLR